MLLYAASFAFGMLTILAPCVLPILPIILGASVEDPNNKSRPYIIIASLAVSVVVFSLLIKGSTLLIGVDPSFWSIFSGVIILILGIVTLFPNLWKNITTKIGVSEKSSNALGKSGQKTGIWGSILVGFALGPVFNSCSPTYLSILAIILTVGVLEGIGYLIAYSLGLAFVLMIVAVSGQKIIGKLKWASDPKGKFKKILGVLFILIGLAIATGFDKDVESFLISKGFTGPSNFEQNILDKIEK